MFSQFNHQNASGQLVPAYLPDELSMAILSYLTIPELAFICPVSKATNAMVNDAMIQKSIPELTEFLIFHPEIGFEFLAWMVNRDIIIQKLNRLPDVDPWKILFESLVVEDVNFLDIPLVRSALEAIDKEEDLSDDFKYCLEKIIKIMLIASAQPFFFIGLLKSSMAPLFLNLPHARFCFLGYADVNFKYANLVESDFDFSILERPVFSYSTLAKSKFLQARVDGGDFSEADLLSVNMIGCTIRASTFMRIRGENANFSTTKLIGNNFTSSVFFETSFTHAKVISCDFANCILQNTDFSFSEVSDSNFSTADLRGSNFYGAKLHGIKFIRSKLDGIDFSACLQTGGVSGLDFSRASLLGCCFDHQDLRDACFKEANASFVDFTSADLRGVNFYGANLAGAKFDFAKMIGFECKQGDFSVLKDAFQEVHPFDLKALNLSVILVLQVYLSRLIDEKLPSNSMLITALDLLIGSIHCNLPCTLDLIIDDWRGCVLTGGGGVTCDQIIRNTPISRFNYALSFFMPVSRENSITDLIDDIYQAALASQYRPSTMPS